MTLSMRLRVIRERLVIDVGDVPTIVGVLVRCPCCAHAWFQGRS